MDSGAVDTMAGPKHVDAEDIRETEASKRKVRYTSADGGTIENMGEVNIEAESMEGMPVDLTTQVGDKIKSMLVSVKRTTGAGNMVIFGADLTAIRRLARESKLDENIIVNKKTGTKTRMMFKDGLYKYPMWIKRRKRKGRGKEKEKGDAMQLGMIEEEGQGFWDPF